MVFAEPPGAANYRKPSGYRARWLLDVRGGKAIEAATLVVDGSRIEAIRESGAALDDLDVHEFGHCTILPGLVDAHVHLVWDGSRLDPEGLRAAEGHLKSALRAARHAQA